MSFAVTFGFKEMAKAGMEMGGEFGFKSFEVLHGELESFSPGRMRRSRPTLADRGQIFSEGGVELGFGWGKGHRRKIERGFQGVECLSRRGQRFRNDGWQR